MTALPIVAKLRQRAAWQRENLGDMLDHGQANPELEQAASIITDLNAALETALRDYGNEGCGCTACSMARTALAKAAA